MLSCVILPKTISCRRISQTDLFAFTSRGVDAALRASSSASIACCRWCSACVGNSCHNRVKSSYLFWTFDCRWSKNNKKVWKKCDHRVLYVYIRNFYNLKNKAGILFQLVILLQNKSCWPLKRHLFVQVVYNSNLLKSFSPKRANKLTTRALLCEITPYDLILHFLFLSFFLFIESQLC